MIPARANVALRGYISNPGLRREFKLPHPGGHLSLTVLLGFFAFGHFCHSLNCEKGFPTPLWSPQARAAFKKKSTSIIKKGVREKKKKVKSLDCNNTS